MKQNLRMSLGILMGLLAAGPAIRAESLPSGAIARIGTVRYRALRPIEDARFSADGKRLIGCAGGILYVWKAGDGSLLRTIDTKLEPLDDPSTESEKVFGFAVHPKVSRVACGGIKSGKTYLQIWDFDTGQLIAEKASSCDALRVLAWTPDGTRLLERAKAGSEKSDGWKLIVRDDRLALLRTHDIPKNFGEWSSVMLPMPDSRQVILWQSGKQPTVFDLKSGAVVRTIEHKPAMPSDLAISPDGTMLAATSSNAICLRNIASGKKHKDLPVLRGGWWKPRPLFSPDGKTLYVWDHRPVAYDVASGKEKWKATFRTTHTVRMRLCDISSDGTTLLMRCGHALAFIDAGTGAERDRAPAPTIPTEMVWSPDGHTLFARTEDHDRTWTAWEAASGKRLYDMQPTEFVIGNEWKMTSDLFFLRGGREIAICVEKVESAEGVGSKELLIFDAATGRCRRRLGKPLPDRDSDFRWMHPIGVDENGATVLMQQYVRRKFEDDRYATLRWDPIRQVKLQEWTVEGDLMGWPHYYASYDVLRKHVYPPLDRSDVKVPAAKIRCYSLADGKLVHELITDFAWVEPDRIQGNFLLGVGYASKWIQRRNSHIYTPQPPYAYNLWELPSRQKVRVFTRERKDTAALGSGGQYVLRVLDANTFEIHEPFVLKKAVATVATPCRAERFEFSPDGSRVAVALAETTILVWDTAPWRKQIAEQLARALPADLAPLWDDLAKDAATGLRAARLLSGAADKAITLLRAKVAIRKAPEVARITQWIADLDSPDFSVRERAQKNLRSLSVQAEPHLRKQLQANPTLEMRQRIRNLLEEIEARSLTADEIREVRAVQALEWMNTEAARTLLAKWAEGDPSATLTKAAKGSRTH